MPEGADAATSCDPRIPRGRHKAVARSGSDRPFHPNRHIIPRSHIGRISLMAKARKCDMDGPSDLAEPSGGPAAANSSIRSVGVPAERS